MDEKYSMLGEEHQILRESVREFLENEVSPYIEQWEEDEAYPVEVLRKMGELGFLGLRAPEEYGGGGGDYWSVVVMLEELMKGSCHGLFTAIGVHSEIVVPALVSHATHEQKLKYLVPAARGESLGALAVTEPEAGSDVAGIRTAARRDGDSYVINGSKTFISNGARADWVILATRTEEDPHRGITEFIVDTNTPGFEVGKKLEKAGLRTCDTAELFFSDMRVPVENMLGELNGGFYQIMSNFQSERLMIAIGAYAAAEQALQMVTQYVGERKQFGKPISSFQHNSFKIAEMATRVEAAKELTYRAADMYNRGLECNKEVSMAKWYASEVANQVMYHSMQLMGGYGYIMEYPMQRLWRDSKVFSIVGGTTEIQKLIIARELGLRNR